MIRERLAEELYRLVQTTNSAYCTAWESLSEAPRGEWLKRADFIINRLGLDLDLLATILAEDRTGLQWFKLSQADKNTVLSKMQRLIEVWLGKDDKPVPTDEMLMAWLSYSRGATSPEMYLALLQEFNGKESGYWHRELWDKHETFRAAFRRPQ